MHPAASLWLFLASVKQNMALPRNVIPARSRRSDTLFYFDASVGSVLFEIQRLRPLSRDLSHTVRLCSFGTKLLIKKRL